MGIANAWRELWRPNPSTIEKPIKQRTYAGAQMGRLTSSWVTTTNSADNDIKGSLKKLRNRSRQLIRDVDYCKNAVRAITDNVVGTGIRLQSQIRQQRGGKYNQRLNDQVEKTFAEWSHADSCDVAGKLCFNDLCRSAVSNWVESGEVFIRIIRGATFGNSSIPLALQLLESDMVDEDYQGKAPKDHEWRMGVLVNKWGRPKKYAVFMRHPGDDLFNGTPANQKRHIFIDAKDVIHLAKFERPGQTRGVPWLSSAIQRMHHLEGYEQAEIISKRINSAQTAWIQSPEGELSGDDVIDGERVYDLSPGQVNFLSPGETVHVPNLDNNSGQFEPFLRAMLRALSAGIGVSYSTLSRDSSQSNYSSSRLDLLQDQEAFKAIQYQLKEVFLEVIFKEWIEVAVLSGSLDLPNYQTQPKLYQSARWMFKGYGWVDPMKETQSNKLAVESGFKLQSEVLAERGLDLEEFLTARKNEIDMAQQLGLNFEPQLNTPKQTKVDETNTQDNDDET